MNTGFCAQLSFNPIAEHLLFISIVVGPLYLDPDWESW